MFATSTHYEFYHYNGSRTEAKRKEHGTWIVRNTHINDKTKRPINDSTMAKNHRVEFAIRLLVAIGMTACFLRLLHVFRMRISMNQVFFRGLLLLDAASALSSSVAEVFAMLTACRSLD